MNKKNISNKRRASAIFEVPVVFITVSIMLLSITDFALFFRQTYLTQTVADSILANVTLNKTCRADDITEEVNNQIRRYYPGSREPEFENANGGNGAPFEMANNAFKVQITCINDTPEQILFSHLHKGIFLFSGGIWANSNISPNNVRY